MPNISAAIAAMPAPQSGDWSGAPGRAGGGGTWASATATSATGASTKTAAATKREAKSDFDVFIICFFWIKKL